MLVLQYENSSHQLHMSTFSFLVASCINTRTRPNPPPSPGRVPTQEMASYNGRTHDWVLELHSLHSLDDPTVPASPNAEDDHVELTRRSTEITAAEAALPNRPRSRPASTCSEPLPGAAECLDFVKTRRGRFRPARQTRLRNNLLGAVGFLELANAGDCAANVCTFNGSCCLLPLPPAQSRTSPRQLRAADPCASRAPSAPCAPHPGDVTCFSRRQQGTRRLCPRTPWC